MGSWGDWDADGKKTAAVLKHSSALGSSSSSSAAVGASPKAAAKAASAAPAPDEKWAKLQWKHKWDKWELGFMEFEFVGSCKAPEE